jgi:hypothetical protein
MKMTLMVVILVLCWLLFVEHKSNTMCIIADHGAQMKAEELPKIEYEYREYKHLD